jgi:hypothetical protein
VAPELVELDEEDALYARGFAQVLDDRPRPQLDTTRPPTIGSSFMSPVAWLPIVAELCALDPPVWVFGGIAEEALLEGSVTREHGDIDLLVDRDALSRHVAGFEAIGYPSLQTYFEVVSGQPLVLGAERDGVPLEVGIYDEMEPGVASFVLPTEEGLTRFILPDDTLKHPVIEIDGTAVRTVSPLALYHLREAFILTGVFGPPRDKDAAIQARLKDTFLSDATEDVLRLRTVSA